MFKIIKKFIEIANAYRIYFDDKFNIKCVFMNGKCQVIERNCGTCQYQKSSHTKYCTYLSSVGCDEHLEFKNNNNK